MILLTSWSFLGFSLEYLSDVRNKVQLVVSSYLALFSFAAQTTLGATGAGIQILTIHYHQLLCSTNITITNSVLQSNWFLPNAVRKDCEASQAGKHPAVVAEHRVVLVSPGPALTPGLILDISRWILRDKCRLLPNREPGTLHSSGPKWGHPSGWSWPSSGQPGEH